VAERFAQADPYVTSGAVKRWYVREWTTVAGEKAAMPVRPDAESGSDSSPEKGLILRMWKARSTDENMGSICSARDEEGLPTASID